MIAAGRGLRKVSALERAGGIAKSRARGRARIGAAGGLPPSDAWLAGAGRPAPGAGAAPATASVAGAGSVWR